MASTGNKIAQAWVPPLARRPHGFVPIPFYKRYCGWCGRVTQFGHAHNMTVCGVCGN